MKHVIIAIVTLLAMAGTAQADGLYVMGAASQANLSEFDTDNLGWSGEVGYTTGMFAGGVEISNHNHLGNETLGAALNGHVFIGEWVIRPYVTGGVGATFEGDPFGQAGGGLLWVANDGGEAGSFGIFAGYEHRWYFDSGFDNTGDDGYAKAGIMLTF